MPLKIISGDSADSLIAHLSERIKEHTGEAPLERTLIVSPTLTMMKWISLRVAEKNGISANLEMKFPDRLTTLAIEAFLGENSPALSENSSLLVWEIMDSIGSQLEKTSFKEVKDHLSPAEVDEKDRQILYDLRLFRLSRMVADLFDQYAVFRREMVLDWEAGIDSAAVEHPWQPELWRTVMKGKIHKANLISKLESGRMVKKLPGSIFIFGVRLMTPFHRDLITFLKKHCEIYFYDIGLGSPGRGSELTGELKEELRSNSGKKQPSVFIHSCHSMLREAEALKDQLLEIFDKDKDILLDDVIINVPDLEAYAPYISAVFGSEGDNPLDYMISGRTTSRQSPVYSSFLTLLRLPDIRFTASEMLGLFEHEPVMRCFGASNEDLIKVREWVRQSRIAWGVDGKDRAERFNVPAFEENSWREGLKRLFLAYVFLPEAQSDKRKQIFEEVLPAGNIEESDLESLAKFDLFIDRAILFREKMSVKMTISSWRETLMDLVDLFIYDPRQDEDEETDVGNLRAIINELCEYRGEMEVSSEIIFESVSSGLSLSRPGRSSLIGGITFCSPANGRGIPAKLTGFMGMAFGAFPRMDPISDIDLMGKPRPHDRSQRLDDREGFIEAFNNSEKAFIVTYTGQDMKDNSEIPPSVCIDELLENVTGDRRKIFKHRLHSFDPMYFEPGSGLKSFSETSFHTAEVLASGRSGDEYPRFFRQVLPPDIISDLKELALDDLKSFYDNPQEYLFENILKIRAGNPEEEFEDFEPFGVSHLESFLLQKDLIEDLLNGKTEEELFTRERDVRLKSGEFPPGRIGEIELKKIISKARDFADRVKAMAPFYKQCLIHSRNIDLSLNGARLIGNLNIKKAPDKLLYYRPANIKMRDLFSIWIDHLIINLDERIISMAVFRGEGLKLNPMESAAEAKHELENLISYYKKGLLKPACLFSKSSLEYAERMKENEGDREAALECARRKFEPGYNDYGSDMNDPRVARCFSSSSEALECTEFRDWYEEVLKPLFDKKEVLEEKERTGDQEL